jgi:hypothetical protein
MDLTQNSFQAGELSPRMRGRTDLPEYYAGTRREENFLSKPTGGAVRRPGFEVVGYDPDSGTIGGEL